MGRERCFLIGRGWERGVSDGRDDFPDRQTAGVVLLFACRKIDARKERYQSLKQEPAVIGAG